MTDQPTDPATTALAPTGDAPLDLAGLNLATAPFTWKTLYAIAKTDFVPRELRGKPTAILACIMYGREWGLGPMESLQLIDVIDGRPGASSQLLVSRVFAAGHEIFPKDLSDQGATAVLVRHDPGREPRTFEFRFTLEDAKRAGLAGKDNFKHYPAVMCYWRAASQLVRFVAPDVLGPSRGYTPDELGADVPPEPIVAAVETQTIELTTGEIVVEGPDDIGGGDPTPNVIEAEVVPEETPVIVPEPQSGPPAGDDSSPTLPLTAATEEFPLTSDEEWGELRDLIDSVEWIHQDTIPRMEAKVRRLCQLMVNRGVWKPKMQGLDPLHAALVSFQAKDERTRADGLILAHWGDLGQKNRMVRFALFITDRARDSISHRQP